MGISNYQLDHLSQVIEVVKIDEVFNIYGFRNMKNERYFSMLSFMKNKLINQVTIHLDLIVWMYA